MKIPDYSKKIKRPTYLKMQEEIKRLKEEYVILQNASDEVEEEKDKEIERLNNIINELEKIISLDFNYVNNDLSDNFVLGIRNEAKSIYRELQELKGSGKE